VPISCGVTALSCVPIICPSFATCVCCF
jgi:hypothetical protein